MNHRASSSTSHYRNHQQNYRQQAQSLDPYSSSGGSGSHRFSLSDSDFQRDAVLKRQRYLSPTRASSAAAAAADSNSYHSNSSYNSNNSYSGSRQQQPPHRPGGGAGMRAERPVPTTTAPAARGRSKSKSRARRSVPQPPKPGSSDYIPLGRSTHTTNTNKATYHGSSRMTTRSRSRSVAAAAQATKSSSSHETVRRSPSAHRGRSRREKEEEEEARDRARERERKLEREREALPLPKVTLTKSSAASKAAAKEKARSKSKARSSKSEKVDGKLIAEGERQANVSVPELIALATRVTTPLQVQVEGAAKENISAESDRLQRALDDAKKDLQKLQDEMDELQKRMESKKYQIKHLELDLEVVEKRKRIEMEYDSRGSSARVASEVSHRNNSNSSTTAAVSSHRDSDRQKRSASRARGASKRPCIVDTDESEDDEVVILEPVQFKQEQRPQKRQRSSSKSRNYKPSSSTVSPPVQVPTDTSHEQKQIPDYFWGKADTAKLLAQHKVRTIPDGHVRKIRHLTFNPMKSDYFATSSDDGGMIIWNYERPTHEITKMGTFAPSSFRRDSQCAESIAWSPDGNRMAMAFRDPLNGKGEFCVVMLHNLPLTGSEQPQDIPKDRVTSMSTTLHSRGISTIEWIPSGYGSEKSSRSLVTAGSDHAVVLWEEHDDANKEHDYKWKVLHREHRSEVKSICVHSQRQAVFTGGFDGQVIRYDLHKFVPQVVMERRKPSISKINAVLEHPHNPHILLVSAVEQAEHSILLHDLRQRYSSSRDSTMTLSWVKSSNSRSMSQYIVPRWSPAGMHVSCGSKSGLVNIWDVRVRGSSYPVVLPHQSIAVHQKTVLHATWHPRYDALFSVSNDRTLGLLTFK